MKAKVIKPKKCPFCRRPRRFVKVSAMYRFSGHVMFQVHCYCGARGTISADKERAVILWNEIGGKNL